MKNTSPMTRQDVTALIVSARIRKGIKWSAVARKRTGRRSARMLKGLENEDGGSRGTACAAREGEER